MRSVILLIFVSLLPFGTHGQKKKIAYKDVFVYLSNNQFTDAEPLLRQYLRENETNANAFMYMGYIFESRFQIADFLRSPKESSSLADSAIFYLDLCVKNLTEKLAAANNSILELKKEKENAEKKSKAQTLLARLEKINQLKPNYKEVLKYRYFDDLSIKEISKKLNQPISTIKIKIFRACCKIFSSVGI